MGISHSFLNSQEAQLNAEFDQGMQADSNPFAYHPFCFVYSIHPTSPCNPTFLSSETLALTREHRAKFIIHFSFLFSAIRELGGT